MVATSQPLAAQAGLGVLQAGGNAADAAVATAAVLAVVEPMSTGIGGDAFALYFDGSSRQVTALNGSGRAPAAMTLEAVQRAGLKEIPLTSALSVTVPGAVAAWADLLAHHGTLSLADLLQPAISYARDGYPVSEVVAFMWQRAAGKLSRLPSGRELLVDGRPPRLGEVVRLPDLAHSLEAIASDGPETFYQGALAQDIARVVQAQGGWMTVADLATHHSTWEKPISVPYRGLRLWECPPNGQGLAALLAAGITEGFDLASLDEVQRWHVLIEAMSLAFADAQRWVADPVRVDLPLDTLLSPTYLAERRTQIDLQRSNPDRRSGVPLPGSDTVYLSVVDSQGNACSFINSVFEGFGSGLVVPGTGIALHNRGALFSLDPGHPNRLEPGKRPYHTIIPAMITQGEELWACFGVMGDFMQPQGHLQVLVGLVDLDRTPQEALDAPRFRLLEGESPGRVAVEGSVGLDLIRQLEARGHDVVRVEGEERLIFGAGQVIKRDLSTGVLMGGSDPRRDGCAVGW
jgi:gamma-glutamyltranspeptidase/glutathione hydrolase